MSPPSPFTNVDLDDNYRAIDAAIKQPDALNFIVDFGKSEAIAAVNLEDWGHILDADHLARRYGFSPRLLAIMSSQTSPLNNQREGPTQSRTLRNRFRGRVDAQTAPDFDDLEKKGAIGLDLQSESRDQTLDLNHYRLVDDVWHYCSVDWGDKCEATNVCIGYNALHSGPSFNQENTNRSLRDVPKGKRIWVWLVLCSDGTVISMYEDTLPALANKTFGEEAILLRTRKNLLNVFKHLSHASMSREDVNPIFVLNIRGAQDLMGEDDPDPTGQRTAQDAPSLLFYYLFDDWYSTYGLVARQEHQYGAELNILRENITRAPNLEDIDRLYHIGRQLGVLKRMYESYKLIIDRMLEKQKPTYRYASQQTLQGSPLARDWPDPAAIRLDQDHRFDDTQAGVHAPLRSGAIEKAPGQRVRLAPAAAERFERLRDRITLLTFTEIQECIESKESLVFTV
ncbi:MAG: hypothetical protein M1825_003823 [Sarcosagium campestre]|nr:MAG: hypothetical protein M1825_003823 [Sarcosagium campestre]